MSVLSKVQRTFLFPWNNHSTVQISRSFRTPFARLRRKLLRTIRSVEKRNELKTIITLLDLLLLLLFYAISQPRLLRMLDFPVFRFAPPLLCLSTQDFSDKKKRKEKEERNYTVPILPGLDDARLLRLPFSGKRWLIIARFPAKLFINALHGPSPSPDSPEDGVMRYPGGWNERERRLIFLEQLWYYLSFVSCIFNDNPVFSFSFLFILILRVSNFKWNFRYLLK